MANNEETGRDSETIVTIRTAEMAVAALVFAFGALFMYGSYILGIGWGAEGPQAGYFPFYVDLIICISAVIIFIQVLRAPRGGNLEEAFVERGQLKRVLQVLIPAGLFILGIQLIGIYISGAIYIIGFMRFIGRFPWWRSVLTGVLTMVVFFVVFEAWFLVPLYKGMWDLTAWTGY
ncbi:MAG TPA: tripartite tricarboxylate transporter TctB family protein [Burkholderiales bacterium]|nr:tripartite tricarboxylate transporter TctB family protein [Burkholderiales bacterium]